MLSHRLAFLTQNLARKGIEVSIYPANRVEKEYLLAYGYRPTADSINVVILRWKKDQEYRIDGPWGEESIAGIANTAQAEARSVEPIGPAHGINDVRGEFQTLGEGGKATSGSSAALPPLYRWGRGTRSTAGGDPQPPGRPER